MMLSVLPTPKRPKRNTHANIAISITFLMPKRMRKNDVSRIHKASDICDSDTSIVGFEANQLSDVAEKLSIYGVAKPFVICNDTPRSIEKMKNIAMVLDLKSTKPSRPRRCARLFFSVLGLNGHWGSVKQ
jgi:hypothetical protein